LACSQIIAPSLLYTGDIMGFTERIARPSL